MNTESTENLRYEEVPCALCGGTSRESLYRRESNPIGIVIELVQCDRCGNVYNSPRPSQEFFDFFYSEANSTSATVFREHQDDSHYGKRNRERLNFLINEAPDGLKGLHIDVGSGSGMWLSLLQSSVSELHNVGIEPSGSAASAVTDATGIQVVCGGWEKLANFSEVDLISMVSVVEHLVDPVSALVQARKSLKTDGLLFLEVPNTLNPVFSFGGYFGLEHLTHFSPYTFSVLLEAAGLAMLAIDRTCADAVRVVASPKRAGVVAVDIPSDTSSLSKSVQDFQRWENDQTRNFVQEFEGFIRGLKSRNHRVAVYGAGEHTSELLSCVSRETAQQIDFFVDGDPLKQASGFAGRRVYAPQDLPGLAPAGIVISSQRFRLEIRDLVDKIYSGNPPDVLDFP